MKTIGTFKAWCVANGDSPEAVKKFVDWLIANKPIWEAFKSVAVDQYRKREPGDPMACMGILRKKKGVFAVNAVSPGLCRFFNYMYGVRYFKTAKMTKFNPEFRGKEAA